MKHTYACVLLFLIAFSGYCETYTNISITDLLEKSRTENTKKNYTEGLRYSLLALKETATSKDSALIADVWLQTAISYNLTRQLDSAVVYSKKALWYGENHTNTGFTIKCIGNLAMLLNKVGDHNAALSKYLEAKTYYENQPASEKMYRKRAIAHYNTALTYSFLKNTPKSISDYKKGLYYAKKTDFTAIQTQFYGSIAELYEAQGNPIWEMYLDSSIALSKKTNNTVQIIYGINKKAQNQLNNNNSTLALNTSLEALDLLENSTPIYAKSKVYETLSKAYQFNKDPKNSLKYATLHYQLKRKIDSMQQPDGVVSLESAYEFLKLEKKLLNEEIKIAQLQLTNSRWIGISLFLGTLLLLIVLTRLQRKKMFKALFAKEKAVSTYLKIVHDVELIAPIASETSTEKNELKQLYVTTRKAIQQNKWFLNPEFSIEDCAKELGSNQKYISQAINTYHEANFRNFINGFRIERSKHLLKQALTNKTVEFAINELWDQCGFKSNPQFYRVFKAFTGLTPKAYYHLLEEDIKNNTNKKK